MAPSLDGRVFVPHGRAELGEVDAGTAFSYHEADGVVWADYAGGDIVRGHLVGTRDGDTIDFRYVQLNAAGETSSGHCRSTLTELPDGRLRMTETWEWESRPGTGTSTVEESPASA
ncbi:hypothetical protein [Yinghuangia seranimata]|uniref:hypothetical protein n=1 Tax=Yinghuangia seranimata TaxID=408067 RepID=UPI00248BD70C|nr:hypothetical protein [Yinghuangia seranimata]MDI2124537.1 hypothetical protein [Yinghuangia seranimata]